MRKDDWSEKENIIYQKKGRNKKSSNEKGKERPRPVTQWTEQDNVPAMQQVAGRFGVTVTPGEVKQSTYRHPKAPVARTYQQQYVVIQRSRPGDLSPFYGATRAAARHQRRHRDKQTPQ